MPTTFPMPSRHVIVWLVLAATALTADAAPTGADEDAAVAFNVLDDAPRDGVLTGREREAVEAYDGDGDGRVTREEFTRGFVSKQPAAWQRHEFDREKFSCEMPLAPRPLGQNAAAARFQVVADVAEPRVVLLARSRDISPRSAGKPAAFFDGIAERIEKGGARIKDRRPADLGLHRGEIIEIEWGDGREEMVRAVIRGPVVYELDAIMSPDAGPAGRAMATRFLGSLQFTR